MSDQADKLRRLTRTATVEPAVEAAPLPMVVVSGGRSGVGATTVAVNLAAAMADCGERVLVVDAAESGSELAEVAGIAREIEYTVADVLAGRCGAREALVRGPVGLHLLTNRGGGRRGGRGVEFRRNSATVGEFSRGAQHRLFVELELLRDQFDVMIVDASHGLTAWTRRFWVQARLVVLVATTNDAAVLDAYAALKLSVADGIRPAIRLLVNQADSTAVAEDAHRRMQLACRQFLSLSIEALPPLPLHSSEDITGAFNAPRVWEAANSPFGHAALWISKAVSEVLGPCATACGEPNCVETLTGTARC